jgi:hypothetical protein
MMKEGMCRYCHSAQEINGSGQIKSHTNKYTQRSCRGCFKPPVERLKVEPPMDFAPSPAIYPDAEGNFGGLIVIYLGGVLTGAIISFLIF